MPTGVATAPTPAGKADRAHPVGVMCREPGHATLWLLEMGSEGVSPDWSQLITRAIVERFRKGRRQRRRR
jgi:hypothetical protein